MKNDCSTCSYFHLYEEVSAKSPLDKGCCNCIDANPSFKTANEKSAHPFRMFFTEVESCPSWKENKDEEGKPIQVKARTEKKTKEHLPEKPRDLQEPIQGNELTIEGDN